MQRCESVENMHRNSRLFSKHGNSIKVGGARPAGPYPKTRLGGHEQEIPRAPRPHPTDEVRF
jgi:hypothetical protein